MRACARVALASIAVSASFSLSGCAAIEVLNRAASRPGRAFHFRRQLLANAAIAARVGS